MRPLKATLAFSLSVFVLTQVAVATPTTAQETDFGAWDDARKETFLLEAEVIEKEILPIGVTNSKRLTLRFDGITHDAHFQIVRRDPGRERGPRDHWGYNIAAYRLDRILDLRMVPPSVERRIGGQSGALTWWIDDVAMMEKERGEKNLRAPDPAAWAQQIRRSRVFTQLTYDVDANAGNLLITHDWTLRLIDFTRAFGRSPRLLKEPELLYIDEPLFRALQALEYEQLKQALAPYVGSVDIKGLMKRRDKIVEKFAHLYPDD